MGAIIADGDNERVTGVRFRHAILSWKWFARRGFEEFIRALGVERRTAARRVRDGSHSST